MMKNTKRNWMIVILTGLGVSVASTATNIATAKKMGWTFNWKKFQYEKKDAFILEDLQLDEKLQRNNLVWSIIGAIVGMIVHYTIIDRK